MKTDRNEMIWAYSNDDNDVELDYDTIYDEESGEEIGWAVADDEIWFFD